MNFYIETSITADGSTLATVQLALTGNLWVANLGSSSSFSPPRQITSGISRADAITGITWTQGDKIIYTYYTSGSIRIASSSPDGSNLHDISSSSGLFLWVSACGDGQHFVYEADGGQGGMTVWRADLDGGNVRQLTPDGSATNPNCSRDGKFAVYIDESGDVPRLMKIGIDGGTPAEIAKAEIRQPAISPDGGSVAAVYTPTPGQPVKLAVIGIEGGEIRSVYDLPAEAEASLHGDGGEKLAWTKDGRDILYPEVKNGVASIWAQPVAPPGVTPAPARQVMSLGTDFEWGAFALSPDGKQIIYARGQHVTDAVLITHFH